MKFKITYNQGDTINKSYIVDAENKLQALNLFWSNNSEADDVSKVERISENEY